MSDNGLVMELVSDDELVMELVPDDELVSDRKLVSDGAW